MYTLLLIFAILTSLKADPIIIRSGVSSHKDEGKGEDSKFFDSNSAKGATSYEAEAGVNKESDSKQVQAQDTGKYNEENAQKNVNANEQNYAADKFHQAQGGEEANFNKKSATKKGHHKSGYTKSFHKDESASSSSYYDDADDEDGAFVQNNKKNLYGDTGQESHRGANLDDRRYAQNQGKQGFYNNAGNYEKGVANNKEYNNRQYYDGHENEGRRGVADRYGEEGRYGQEKYLKSHPHYYEPDYYHHAPVKKITIYEDPRYDGLEKYPSSYDSDYVQLEVKRPPRDYDYRDYKDRYNRRPYYDYYY